MREGRHHVTRRQFLQWCGAIGGAVPPCPIQFPRADRRTARQGHAARRPRQGAQLDRPGELSGYAAEFRRAHTQAQRPVHLHHPRYPQPGLCEQRLPRGAWGGEPIGDPFPGISLEDIIASRFWNDELFNNLQYYWQTSLMQPVGGMDMIWKGFLMRSSRKDPNLTTGWSA